MRTPPIIPSYVCKNFLASLAVFFNVLFGDTTVGGLTEASHLIWPRLKNLISNLARAVPSVDISFCGHFSGSVNMIVLYRMGCIFWVRRKGSAWFRHGLGLIMFSRCFCCWCLRSTYEKKHLWVVRPWFGNTLFASARVCDRHLQGCVNLVEEWGFQRPKLLSQSVSCASWALSRLSMKAGVFTRGSSHSAICEIPLPKARSGARHYRMQVATFFRKLGGGPSL